MWYEYIHDEAMNAIEDYQWVVDWNFANFPPPVQAREAKGLEHGVSCNAAIFTDSTDN